MIRQITRFLGTTIILFFPLGKPKRGFSILTIIKSVVLCAMIAGSVVGDFKEGLLVMIMAVVGFAKTVISFPLMFVSKNLLI